MVKLDISSTLGKPSRILYSSENWPLSSLRLGRRACIYLWIGWWIGSEQLDIRSISGPLSYTYTTSCLRWRISAFDRPWCPIEWLDTLKSFRKQHRMYTSQGWASPCTFAGGRKLYPNVRGDPCRGHFSSTCHKCTLSLFSLSDPWRLVNHALEGGLGVFETEGHHFVRPVSCPAFRNTRK